jgi:hypothetical protein
MGDQGLGTRSPFQMLWVFAKMMSEIHERGGIALNNVPQESEHAATQQFFYNMVDQFLHIFGQNLKKHIITRWRSDKMIVYLLGGEPELAKQFSRTLVYWNGDAGVIRVDDNGKLINNDMQYANYPEKPFNLESTTQSLQSVDRSKSM